MASRSEVFAALNSERAYQDMRKKRDQGQTFHSAEEFILYMEHYLHLAREVASTTWGPEAKPKTMEVVRKVTALGVAAMEQHGAPQRPDFNFPAGEVTRLPTMDVGEYATDGERLVLALEAIRGLPAGYLGQSRHESRHGGVSMGDRRDEIIETLKFYVDHRLGKPKD